MPKSEAAPTPPEDPDPGPVLAGANAWPLSRTGLAACALAACVLPLVLYPASSEPPKELQSRLEFFARRIEPVDELPPLLTPSQQLEAYRREQPDAVARALATLKPLQATGPHGLFEAWFKRVAYLDPDVGLWFGFHPHPQGMTRATSHYEAQILVLCAELDAAVGTWKQGRDLTPHQVADLIVLRQHLSEWSDWRRESESSSRLIRLAHSLDPLVYLVTFECCPADERRACAVSRLREFEAAAQLTLTQLESPSEAIVLNTLLLLANAQVYVEDYPWLWEERDGALIQACKGAAASIESVREALERDVLPRAADTVGMGREAYERRLRFSTGKGVDFWLREALAEFEDANLELAHLIPRLPPAMEVASTRERDRLLGAYPEVVQNLASRAAECLDAPKPDEPGVQVEPLPFVWAPQGRDCYLDPGPFAPEEARLQPRFFTAELPDAPVEELRILSHHIAAHETYPGHHQHFLASSASSCALRFVFSSAVSVEGWATYAEELIHEAGIHLRDPLLDDYWRTLARSGVAFEAAFEALLHSGAASPDELLSLLKLYTQDPSLTLAAVGERGFHEDLNSSYFRGQRAVIALRKRVAAAQGAEFDLGRFHRRFLAAGFVPPRLLDAELTQAPASSKRPR